MDGKYPDPVGKGAMWIKKSKKETEFLSGVLEFSPAPGLAPIKVQFVAFPAAQKVSDRSPDYWISVNSSGPGQVYSGGSSRGAPPQGAPGLPQSFVGRTNDDEDIPF